MSNPKEKYRCLIVDDETLAQELIEAHLAKIPELELVGKCHTAIEAGAMLQLHKIDLLFLDVEMPHLSGVDFLKSLSNPPTTILTTAYSEFAVQAYEMGVIDYLLKPITFPRFFKSTTKALEKLASETPNRSARIDVPKEYEIQANRLYVRHEHKISAIQLEDILYVEAMQKYVRFWTSDKKVMTLMSLTKLESTLPPAQFFRIHKSYIIQLTKITEISGNMVKIGAHEIPISKQLKAELLEKIDAFGLL
jgi:DNA-binding LytR/AlgR family response regulator